jgi:hypothetical protein
MNIILMTVKNVESIKLNDNIWFRFTVLFSYEKDKHKCCIFVPLIHCLYCVIHNIKYFNYSIKFNIFSISVKYYIFLILKVKEIKWYSQGHIVNSWVNCELKADLHCPKTQVFIKHIKISILSHKPLRNIKESRVIW